jgi:hypothetical protein
MAYEDRDESHAAPSTPPVNHYLGNLTEKTRKSGDKFLVGSICLDDIEAIPAEHINTGKNKSGKAKRYVKIIVNPYRDGKNQYGNTHSVKVDTYRPQEQRAEGGRPEGEGRPGSEEDF